MRGREVPKKMFIYKRHYVREYYEDTFLGEKVLKWWHRFRFTDNFERAQECENCSLGCYWRTLSEEEIKVLKSKVVEDGNDYKLLSELK